MSLITLFSAPKPYNDERIRTIQENAISSWCQLPDVQILLMGQELGLREAAERHGVTYVPEVQRNKSGTPLISSMVQIARERSQSPLLCIVNADMIVMQDFVAAAKTLVQMEPRFVFVSRRWDLDVETLVGFSEGWQERMAGAARERGALHRPAGSDLFLFPRSCYADLPEFAIGRAGWDNWMIYKARKEHWPVIDGTPSLTLIHQNHDYSHLPGGSPHYSMPESDENIRLAGGDAAIRYTIVDATHCWNGARLTRPRPSYRRFVRSVELLLRAAFFFLPPQTVEQLARPKRWKRRVMKLLGMR